MVHFPSKPVLLTLRLSGCAAGNSHGGPCHLREPEIARMVVDAIYHYAKRLRYFDLHAFVVMANHVDLLLTPRVPVAALADSLKDLTAREAAHRWQIHGPFWEQGGRQVVVQNPMEFERLAKDIEMEPVTAGMVCTPGEFPWTSAAAD